MADAARSRELIEHMSAAHDAIASGAVPRELMEGDLLLRRIDELVRQLREMEQGQPRERGQPRDTAGAALAAELAADRGTVAMVPGALGWHDSPPSVCMPYLEGLPLLSVLGDPGHPTWSRSRWDPRSRAPRRARRVRRVA